MESSDEDSSRLQKKIQVYFVLLKKNALNKVHGGPNIIFKTLSFTKGRRVSKKKSHTKIN